MANWKLPLMEVETSGKIPDFAAAIEISMISGCNWSFAVI